MVSMGSEVLQVSRLLEWEEEGGGDTKLEGLMYQLTIMNNSRCCIIVQKNSCVSSLF